MGTIWNYSFITSKQGTGNPKSNKLLSSFDIELWRHIRHPFLNKKDEINCDVSLTLIILIYSSWILIE